MSQYTLHATTARGIYLRTRAQSALNATLTLRRPRCVPLVGVHQRYAKLNIILRTAIAAFLHDICSVIRI
jgi:hypothetical protein